MADINYFVCTLGQAAAQQNGPKPYQTISEFLSHQSKHHGDTPAVGFYMPQRETDWSHQVLTFRDVNSGTHIFAQGLSKAFELDRQTSQTVALLCHSSPEFLFTWLGLIRLGHSVLLIAPQCQPSAIIHLCKSCNVSLLLHDEAHAERARDSTNASESSLRKGLILYDGEEVFRIIRAPLRTSLADPKVDEADVAYLHHTSGTSTGLSKPIAQTHRAAIGILPHLPTTPSLATFTTTPLYHGGIADLFRSWTSDSLIWLFPAKELPITARNICKCLETAACYSSVGQHPNVKYFSSVPYVLQMMEADDDGLAALEKMDIVGVGGAALPAAVGHRLVDGGVNLISRFGSAECGFLLSSYRNFAADKEWQYLRNYTSDKFLDFESRDEGLAELVVKPDWPHMAKKNRDDGSYVTADLFAKHPNIENAWLYHSRADSQLTLITGKKFDPAPLEAAIATSQYLDDVLIFGNNRPYSGALLLRSEMSKEVAEADLIELIWPLVKKLNEGSQDHAQLPKNMLIPVPHQIEPLEKSSKGTIIRRAAEARFSALIDAAYDASYDVGEEYVDDVQIPEYLIRLIEGMVPNSVPLEQDTELFSYGVDSIVCMRLRNRLRQLIPKDNHELPLSVVEDCGTVGGLSSYILRKRHGAADIENEDEDQLMLDLVKEYSSFEYDKWASRTRSNGSLPKGKKGNFVVLTGATGALGAHLLNLLRKSDLVSAVYCLVRGVDEKAARERVSQALEQRGFPSILAPDNLNNKIHIVQAQLGEPRLGLTKEIHDFLAAEADLILHVAWTVNFRLKLRSFEKDNIAGLANLLKLALAAGRTQPPRFAYCSSTAAVMHGKTDKSGQISETISRDPSSASPLGYSRSKWVAEQVCAAAHAHTLLRDRITIIRVGQLSGASTTGIWNSKEAWPIMLSTLRLIGCLPNLGDEPLDWLPVDLATEAFLQASQQPTDEAAQDPAVYHVLNPHQISTWRDMLHWLKKREDFEIVEPREWIRRLEQSGENEHSAMKLLGLWKESYAGTLWEKTPRPRFSVEKTKRMVPALGDVRPVDEVYVGKIWEWVKANVR